MTRRDYLLTIDIFRDLPTEAIDMLDRQVRTVTCEKGRTLYSQEEHGEALFLLKQGMVELGRGRIVVGDVQALRDRMKE